MIKTSKESDQGMVDTARKLVQFSPHADDQAAYIHPDEFASRVLHDLGIPHVVSYPNPIDEIEPLEESEPEDEYLPEKE